MGYRDVVIFVLSAVMFLGCASSGVVSGTAAPASGGSSGMGVSAAASAVSVGIQPACRDAVSSFSVKSSGSLEVLAADRSLYSIGANDQVSRIRSLSDDVQNYSLLPQSNVIIHWHDDRIIVESLINGDELFKLDGAPDSKMVWLSQDGSELALKNKKGRFNIWKTEKGFGGITGGETVQDFINRQSPDHQIGFPQNSTFRAMSVGSNGNFAVALDDNNTGKVGLIYHLDIVNAPDRLAVLSRTNTPVQTVRISGDAAHVAAVDSTGQLFLIPTAQKSFLAFASKYRNAKDVLFSGGRAIVTLSDKIVALELQNGAVAYEIPGSFENCVLGGTSLYCAGEGYLNVFSAATGALYRKIAFHDGLYAIVENGQISGNMPETCR